MFDTSFVDTTAWLNWMGVLVLNGSKTLIVLRTNQPVAMHLICSLSADARIQKRRPESGRADPAVQY
jgi:hypothetical protein